MNTPRIHSRSSAIRHRLIAFTLSRSSEQSLPYCRVELKNAADENATIWTAFQQLQTYKAEIPAVGDPTRRALVADLA